MRKDIEFDAQGTTLRGWLYSPDSAPGPTPLVVMAHGFSATKEMTLDRYAEVFAAAGLSVLVYDHRNTGASDGQPRFDIDPVAQYRDYSHAITYGETLKGIDTSRIGIWGTSYSGAIERISPTPLLMIVAEDDVSTPTELALRAYHRAIDPKRLLILSCDHYGSYLEAFDQSSAAARDWFVEHLT